MSPHILHFYEAGAWYDSCTQTTKSMSHWLVMHVWNKQNKNHMQCFTLDLLCTAAGEIFTVWPQWADAGTSVCLSFKLCTDSSGHLVQRETHSVSSGLETPTVRLLRFFLFPAERALPEEQVRHGATVTPAGQTGETQPLTTATGDTYLSRWDLNLCNVNQLISIGSKLISISHQEIENPIN